MQVDNHVFGIVTIRQKPAKTLALLTLAIGIGAIYFMTKGKALGIRNNNPLNMREVGIPWNGKTGDNKGFTTFETPFYGIRAAANDIKNKWLNGIDTIAALIDVWAPDSENDTAAYIASVSQKTGIPAEQKLLSLTQLMQVIEAMIYHENGEQPYDQSLIGQAVADGALSGAALPDWFNTEVGAMYA